jgi:RNA polymerase subunit RPABC4/transcription elongation factor Spt4
MIRAEIWICPNCDDFRFHENWVCDCVVGQ